MAAKERYSSLWSTVVFILTIVGIGGLSWSAFQEGGWVERLFGTIWEAEMSHPLLLVPTIGGILLMVPIYRRGGFASGKGTVFSYLLIYGLMAAGLYHLYKWFLA